MLVLLEDVLYTYTHTMNYGRFATLPVRPLDDSPPGRFAPWTIRPRDDSPPGRFAPWKIRPLDDSPPGLFAPTQWTIRPLRY